MTWHRSVRDPGMWVSIDPEDVEDMKAAIAADKAACPGCQTAGPVRHNTGYILDNALEYEAHTYRCPSFSRWYNPNTRQMEGHAHCTCDYCF